MNYFELYDIPISFLPNKQQLKKKFYELSRKYHPDFYTQENEADQSEALEFSSQVNKAYKTLQDRDETIKYVLQLKGLLEEEEKYQLPTDFLMEMMDLNEQVMDAKTEEATNAFEVIYKTMDEHEKSIYTPVKELIEKYEEDKTTTEDLLKIKDYYFKKKYLKRILAAIQ